VICGVSVPFKGFPQEEILDRTQALLINERELGYIDHLIAGSTPMTEIEARSAALRWLVNQGVEVLVQIDADEFYTNLDISNIFRFVESQPYISWFRLCLKNYVFDNNTYLKEPFTPPRIHRVEAGTYRVHSFNQDNDVAYGGRITRDITNQERFSSMTIPQSIAWISHSSWLSNQRSKKKIEYQWARWGCCSYRWDHIKNVLAFDTDFYHSKGLPLPETISL
jgi:hypothetical protein